MRGILAWLVMLHLIQSASAEDWPRWRGPNCNGISQEKNWSAQWPKEGPRMAWKANVGTGFSSFAVSAGRLYTMGHADNKDTITCMDAATGKQLWSHSYEADLGAQLFEGGPTATPTVDGKWIYTLSRWGDVLCLDAVTGKVRWSRNIQKDAEFPVPSWGFSGSLLVHENLLLLNVGESGMAVEKDTGKTIWMSAKTEAGYSTPVPFQRKGEWYAIFSSGNAYSAVHLKTGKVLWEFPWITRYGVNASDPLLIGDHLFISTGYGKGAVLVKISDDKPTVVWKNKNMRNQINNSVLIDGHLYGIDGDANSRNSLRCVDLKTGEVRWSEEGLGCGSLMAADGKLIVLSEKGELLIAPASSRGFTPSARAQVLMGKCWTVPVLANGRIYCRNAAGDVVCVDVRIKDR